MPSKVKLMDEGYVKFKCNLTKGSPPSPTLLTGLNKWRDKLYELGLIGIYDNGIGFGNISIRHGKDFIVSASATGGLEKMAPGNYVVVTSYSLKDNSLECRSQTNASSESMTHAAIYEASPEAGAVIHVHNLKAWQALLGKVPTTADAPYGTPEMAYEMIRLLRKSETQKQKIIVMAGHKEGIIAWGRDLDEAGKAILDMVAPRM